MWFSFIFHSSTSCLIKIIKYKSQIFCGKNK
nr:MAG TPA: hypothetical protein [Caudoviricetes sp.]